MRPFLPNRASGSARRPALPCLPGSATACGPAAVAPLAVDYSPACSDVTNALPSLCSLPRRAWRRRYVIAFIGVNGVGKSTNLAKVAFWLKQVPAGGTVHLCASHADDV